MNNLYCEEDITFCCHGVPFDFCSDCKNKNLNYISDCNDIICNHNKIKIECKKCHKLYIFI